MDSQCLPFREIPETSRLFLDFLSGNPQVYPFYPTSPRSLDDLATQSRDVEFPLEHRHRVADLLLRQNRNWNAAAETLGNIDKLRKGAVAVVSGQQVGLFLGPLYTVLKAVTVIRLARELTARGVEAVPVFWLASEDHDLLEVNHIFLPDRDGQLCRLETSSHGQEGAPVGTVVLQDEISGLIASLTELVGDSQIGDQLRATYSPGATLSAAFAKLMSELFCAHGLILLDPSDAELHKIATPLLQSSSEHAEALTRALVSRSKELENEGYHAQVRVTNSSTLLFFLKDGKRLPVHRKNGNFAMDSEQWTEADLSKRISEKPELFSPNVLLRPVLQDFLLPTAVYVAGPAETAYFAQVQVVYEQLLGRATPIWPRFSTTLIEPRLGSWMRKYGLRLRDLLQPKEDFRSALAQQTIPSDLKDEFDRSHAQLDRLLTPLLNSLKKMDPTIAAAGEVSARKMRYQLEHLESRAARANLRREQVLARHANLLSSALFPEKELQERRIAGVYFLAKFGTELIDRLIEEYNPECRDHQAVFLD